MKLKNRCNLANSDNFSTIRPPFRGAPGSTGKWSVVQRWLAGIRYFLDLYLYCLESDLSEIIKQVRGKVLDVGCGDQPYRHWFINCSYTGIDRKSAESEFGYAQPDTIFFGDDEAWPVSANNFDFVLASEVFEHVYEPRGFIDNAYSVLVPGGWLCLTVPFSYRWHFIPNDYYRYTPSALFKLLSESNFVEISIAQRGNPIVVIAHKVLVSIFSPYMAGKRCLGILLIFLLSPVWLLVAVIGRICVKLEFGNDPMAFTVLARKPRL